MRKCLKILLIAILIILAASFPVHAATTKQLAPGAKKATVYTGKTYALKIKGIKVTWKAADNAYLKLAKTGRLTLKKAGKTTIKYVRNKATKKITLTIKKAASKSSRSASSVKTSSSGSGSSGSGMVWLSATGEKYHSINNCGRMNPNKARQVSLSSALSQGFTACSKCF